MSDLSSLLRIPVSTSNQPDFNRRVATAFNNLVTLLETGNMDAIEGVYKLSPPTLGDGDQSEVILDPLGSLRIAPPNSIIAGGTITRPADTTAYASGDLVANSTTAASVTAVQVAVGRVNGGTGCIRRVRLSTNHASLAGTEVFRVHLFKNDPAASSGIANGDNGAFSVNGVAAIHIGYTDVTLDRVFRDGSKGIGAPAVGSEIVFDCNTGVSVIYALLECRGAYTPASGEIFTIAVEALRD